MSSTVPPRARPVLACVGEGLAELRLAGASTARLGWGGDVANVAVMAALEGWPARLYGRIGGDALGARMLAFWESSGVDVRHVVVDRERPTGLYVNEPGSAPGGHRFEYVRRGSAGSALAPPDIDGLEDVGVLHVSGITIAISGSAADAARAAACRVRDAGGLLSYAVNARPGLTPDLGEQLWWWRRADALFCSRDDLRAVLGTAELSEVGRLSGRQRIVVTDGAAGAHVQTHDGWAFVRAPALGGAVVDAAGAGDAVAGSFLAGTMNGLSDEAALRRAVTAATLSTRAHGCAASYPTRVQVDRALACRQS